MKKFDLEKWKTILKKAVIPSCVQALIVLFHIILFYTCDLEYQVAFSIVFIVIVSVVAIAVLRPPIQSIILSELCFVVLAALFLEVKEGRFLIFWVEPGVGLLNYGPIDQAIGFAFVKMLLMDMPGLAIRKGLDNIISFVKNKPSKSDPDSNGS